MVEAALENHRVELALLAFDPEEIGVDDFNLHPFMRGAAGDELAKAWLDINCGDVVAELGEPDGGNAPAGAKFQHPRPRRQRHAAQQIADGHEVFARRGGAVGHEREPPTHGGIDIELGDFVGVAIRLAGDLLIELQLGEAKCLRIRVCRQVTRRVHAEGAEDGAHGVIRNRFGFVAGLDHRVQFIEGADHVHD